MRGLCSQTAEILFTFMILYQDDKQGLKEQVLIAMAIVEICITKPNLVAECESCSA